MTEYLIGTGGWAYFKAPNQPSLKAYSEHFNFVEVNYTFYQYPYIRMAQRWRRTVPKDFTFTIRCHQDLTHKIGLKPVDEAYSIFSKMIGICRVLDAPILHLMTPKSYTFDEAKISQAEDFFSSVYPKGVRLAWEIRSPINPEIIALMQDLQILHSVDLSSEEPAYESNTVYARMFGKGKHNIYQFTDEELREIDRKILKAEAGKALVTFHGIRMGSDALRFKGYKETGTFIPVTAYTGVDSAKAVLQEDGRFPSTKAELLEHQGWKVIDLAHDRRVHLYDVLSKIPEKTYNSVEQVTKELRVFL